MRSLYENFVQKKIAYVKLETNFFFNKSKKNISKIVSKYSNFAILITYLAYHFILLETTDKMIKALFSMRKIKINTIIFQ